MNDDVLTSLQRDRLMEQVASEYGFEEVRITSFMEGYGSRFVALLHTSQGKFVLKANDRSAVYAKVVPAYEHLRESGFNGMINLRSTVAGRLFIDFEWNSDSDNSVCDTACYLYPFIEGTSLSGSSELFAGVGHTLGRLHRIEAAPELPQWDLDSLIGDIVNDRLPSVPEPHRSNLLKLTPGFAKLSSLPKAIIHGDVGESNGVYDAVSNRVILIDWDGCGIAPRIIDAAYPLFGLLNDQLQFQWEKAEAYAAAYAESIKLTIEELELFHYAVVLLPCNHILHGHLGTKLARIQWFIDNREQVARLFEL
ncbi:aminoglycoside phosphotransferase family protein [Paenibacillus sp. OV219]|uniref:phosphotransferase n=1 Tax=Paenibacillus sp. OV219 TaxID=1884377 RepID=UPI0008B8688A|nr:aminoglycoside phosphotransferase family protein [Paenibacillus sp. OV219]SEP00844.1 Phosphotransferase enzyme family protein [Paenibacillus sp. OV219]